MTAIISRGRRGLGFTIDAPLRPGVPTSGSGPTIPDAIRAVGTSHATMSATSTIRPSIVAQPLVAYVPNTRGNAFSNATRAIDVSNTYSAVPAPASPGSSAVHPMLSYRNSGYDALQNIHSANTSTSGAAAFAPTSPSDPATPGSAPAIVQQGMAPSADPMMAPVPTTSSMMESGTSFLKKWGPWLLAGVAGVVVVRWALR